MTNSSRTNCNITSTFGFTIAALTLSLSVGGCFASDGPEAEHIGEARDDLNWYRDANMVSPVTTSPMAHTTSVATSYETAATPAPNAVAIVIGYEVNGESWRS